MNYVVHFIEVVSFFPNLQINLLHIICILQNLKECQAIEEIDFYETPFSMDPVIKMKSHFLYIHEYHHLL